MDSSWSIVGRLHVEMWPPVTYTEGIPDRKHSGYIQYTYRGFYIKAPIFPQRMVATVWKNEK